MCQHEGQTPCWPNRLMVIVIDHCSIEWVDFCCHACEPALLLLDIVKSTRILLLKPEKGIVRLLLFFLKGQWERVDLDMERVKENKGLTWPFKPPRSPSDHTSRGGHRWCTLPSLLLESLIDGGKPPEEHTQSIRWWDAGEALRMMPVSLLKQCVRQEVQADLRSCDGTVWRISARISHHRFVILGWVETECYGSEPTRARVCSVGDRDSLT